MVNIDKVKGLCKQNGIKQGYLCESLGLQKVYLNDVARGKSTMSDERIRKIAGILGTTFEYLTDRTEDPLPKSSDLIASADSADEKVVLMLMARLPELSDDEIVVLESLLELPKQEFSHCLNVLKAVMER